MKILIKLFLLGLITIYTISGILAIAFIMWVTTPLWIGLF